jgi:hypothetical protein
MIIKPADRKGENFVFYLDDNHNIVPPDKATIIKVYRDGKVYFLIPEKSKNV